MSYSQRDVLWLQTSPNEYFTVYGFISVFEFKIEAERVTSNDNVIKWFFAYASTHFSSDIHLNRTQVALESICLHERYSTPGVENCVFRQPRL